MAEEEDLNKLSDEELMKLLSDEQLRDISGVKQRQNTLAPILGPVKQFGVGVAETMSPMLGVGGEEAGITQPSNLAAAAKDAPLYLRSMLPDPKGYPEELARTAGQGAPYGLLGPIGFEAGAAGAGKLAANALARTYAYGAGPALQGKVASDITSKVAPGATVPLPWLGAIPASQIAGMAGSMRNAPFAGKITPFTQTDPARAAAAQTIKHETGKWPTVGQIFDNQAQRERELRGRPDTNVRQEEDLTKAYTRRAGSQAEVGRITKGSGGFFDTHFDRVGKNIDNLAANTFADPRIMGTGISNAQLYDDLTNLAGDALRNGRTQHVRDALDIFKGVNDRWVPTPGTRVNPTQPSEVLHDALFRNTPIPGRPPGLAIPTQGRVNMTGEQYQRLRTALHSEAENSEPTKARFLRNIADSLDNGVENTLRAHGSPLAGKWAEARGQYRAMLTLEDAAKRLPPGPIRLNADVMDAADKNISGTRPYLKGQTPFANLTEAAGTVMKPLEEGAEPSLAQKVAEKLPFGSSIVRNMPELIGSGVTAGLHAAGNTWLNSLGGAILQYLMAERKAKNFNPRGTTVGANPVSQAFGRNTIMPIRPQDDIHSKLHAVSRALMLNPPGGQPNQ